MRNIFTACRKIIEAAMVQRGSTTWTIDANDLPTDESMKMFCDSLIPEKQVKWEVKQGSASGMGVGMARVTFSLVAWEKPSTPPMPYQAWRNQQTKP